MTNCEYSVLSWSKPKTWFFSSDGKGKVLRECASQLKGVLTQLFQLSLDLNVLPQSWKESTNILLPKKAHATLSEKKVRKLSLGQYLFKRYTFVPKGILVHTFMVHICTIMVPICTL